MIGDRVSLERVVAVEHPFRLDLALRYLATSPATIAEVVDDSSYARPFNAPSGPAVATVTAAAEGLCVSVEGPGADPNGLERAVRLARRVFGLDADVAALVSIDERDVIAGRYARRYLGLRPLTLPDPFETLVWAILGQQINITFAAKMKRALIDRYGAPLVVGERTFRLFPAPERFVDVSDAEMRELQISRQKASAIRELSRAVAEGRLDLELLRDMPDADVIAEVTRLRGIGRWTAEYLLLRGFGRQDAIPAGDMGLRAVIGRLYGLGRNATEPEVRDLAERWAPWRGVVGFYLWFALQQRDFDAT